MFTINRKARHKNSTSYFNILTTVSSNLRYCQEKDGRPILRGKIAAKLREFFERKNSSLRKQISLSSSHGRRISCILSARRFTPVISVKSVGF